MSASGIFLVVRDIHHPEGTEQALQPTTGGYPHITVAYTGDSVTAEDMRRFTADAYSSLVSHHVSLSTIRINTFTPEGGTERHDVLLDVDKEHCDFNSKVQAVRERLTNRLIGSQTKPIMRDLHVTAKICGNRFEAAEYARELANRMPITVEVTGITVD